MSESLEKYGIYAVLGGIVLLIAGYVWIVLRARRRKVRGRFFFLGFPPAAPVYALFHPRTFTGPLTVFLVGLALAGSPYLINAVAPYLMPLGERAKLVDGQKHLTLTGWERGDYPSVLHTHADASVVQMANPDVTDKTLVPLLDMPNLVELDLSHTAITDAALKSLAKIETLEILRLSSTAITDAGLENLTPLESLRQLDVRETGVSAEALSAWRKAKTGRRGLR